MPTALAQFLKRLRLAGSLLVRDWGADAEPLAVKISL